MSLEIRSKGDVAAQLITADDDFSVNSDTVKKESRLDIACGQRLQSGWTGIDIVDITTVPEGSEYVKHDLFNFPWPIESGSIYEARCSHFVEHIPHYIPGYPLYKDGLILFMEEVYRVLQEHGIIVIDCPYYSSQRAHQDPTHCRSITENTFRYFNKEWMKSVGMDHYDVKANFEVVSTKYILDPDYDSRNSAAQQYAVKYMINSVQDIHVVLRKLPL